MPRRLLCAPLILAAAAVYTERPAHGAAHHDDALSRQAARAESATLRPRARRRAVTFAAMAASNLHKWATLPDPSPAELARAAEGGRRAAAPRGANGGGARGVTPPAASRRAPRASATASRRRGGPGSPRR